MRTDKGLREYWGQYPIFVLSELNLFINIDNVRFSAFLTKYGTSYSTVVQIVYIYLSKLIIR